MSPLAGDQVRELLKKVKSWTLSSDGREIVGEFSFRGYDQTVDFVNRVADVAAKQDHHPEISFGYKNCRVVYTTHAAGGLTENDFICAAQINGLYPEN